uniref:Uncharacterized protein n=1 Tax=Eptatretus burgeri TaxID=7764 RepID=A0A8C4QID8_EPTBU
MEHLWEAVGLPSLLTDAQAWYSDLLTASNSVLATVHTGPGSGLALKAAGLYLLLSLVLVWLAWRTYGDTIAQIYLRQGRGKKTTATTLRRNRVKLQVSWFLSAMEGTCTAPWTCCNYKKENILASFFQTLGTDTRTWNRQENAANGKLWDTAAATSFCSSTNCMDILVLIPQSSDLY